MSGSRSGVSRAALLALAWLLVAATAVALLAQAGARRGGALGEDERDYLRAAVHLVREGRLSHAPIERFDARPDAYREPGYSALIAGVWRATGVRAPASEAEFETSIADRAGAARVASIVHLGLLGLAALAAALAVRVAGGDASRALAAAALVAASPALRHAGLELASENLAAPLVAGFSVVLAALVARPGAARLALAASLAGAAPLVRSSLLVLPVVGALVVLCAPDRRAAPESRRRRAVRALALLGLALVPAALWIGRNQIRLGHPVLADRGGAVLAIRAELDRQVGREGALAAALHWTPLEAARSLAARIAPQATYDRFAWTGEGNYFTRAVRRWRAERAAAGDPLAADRRLAREAAREFLRHPLDHAAATLAVGWRGLFAERSPERLRPLDLGLALGLLLGVALLAFAVRAARDRDAVRLALVAPTLALFAAHALLTENLPRFTVPSLPIAWAVVVLGFGWPRRPASRGA